MKRSLGLIILLAGALLLALDAVAAPQDGAEAVRLSTRTKDGALAGKEGLLVRIQATVKSVDAKKREITITTPDNVTQTLKVGKQVTRLGEFKAGDKIIAEHYELLAFEVRKPTAEEIKNPKVAMMEAAKATKDLPPGIEANMVRHMIVTIENIDLKKETVTIKGPEGEMTTLRAVYPENLKRVKVGETAAITSATGVAITLAHDRG